MADSETVLVYALYFPTSDKYYIGQTSNIKKRMSQHLKSGHVVCKALWKYDDWKLTLLHACKSREAASQIEIEEIRNFNSIAPNGYNLTLGGEGCNGYKHTAEDNEANRQRNLGKKHTEEFKAARRAHKHTDEAKERIRKALIGRPCSPETREKIRKSNQGKKCPETTKRNLEDNPMLRPGAKLKCSITKLKTAIRKLVDKVKDEN